MPSGTQTLIHQQKIDGFRAWQDFVTASFPWLEVDGGIRDFRATVRMRTVGDRSLAAMAADGCRVTRTNRSIDRSDAGFLKVLWQRAGSMTVDQDGRRCRLRAGTVALCDTGRPYRLGLADDAQLVVLTLPYAAIPGWSELSPNVCAAPLGDRRVFAAALAASLTLLDEVEHDERDDSADRILGAVQLLLCASLRRSVDQRGARNGPPRLDLVQQHIASHLDDPDLGPDELAAALHVSRRTLYALFEGQATTPSRLIRDLRLRSVCDALIDRENARRSIFDVALDYGFSDPASFCRTFKSVVGVSPSVWRDRARGPIA